jgi:hypothetical protein
MATLSYIIVTVLFYSIFNPASVSRITAIVSLIGCAVGAMNSFGLAPVPVNALVFFRAYCLLIAYLISKSTFLPRLLSILMAIWRLGLAYVSFASAREHVGSVQYRDDSLGCWPLSLVLTYAWMAMRRITGIYFSALKV